MMAAYIPAPSPAQNSNQAKVGLMVREDAGNALGKMAAVAIAGGGDGARVYSRATAGANAIKTSGSSNGVTAPRWLRLIRLKVVATP